MPKPLGTHPIRKAHDNKMEDTGCWRARLKTGRANIRCVTCPFPDCISPNDNVQDLNIDLFKSTRKRARIR
jgi:hypothetical protein